MPTTLSRCQQVTFQLAGTEAIQTHLEALGVDSSARPRSRRFPAGAWGGRWRRRSSRRCSRHAASFWTMCARLPERGVPESLRLAEEIKQQGRALAQAHAGQEEGEEEESEGMRRIRRGPRAAGGIALVPGGDGPLVSRPPGGRRGRRHVNPDYRQAVLASVRTAPAPEQSIVALLAARRQLHPQRQHRT